VRGPTLSSISELFDTALENCRNQTQQMPGAPQPPCPRARPVDYKTPAWSDQLGSFHAALGWARSPLAGDMRDFVTSYCNPDTAIRPKISLSCTRVDSSRLRCKVNHHCAAGKTRSSSKKPSPPSITSENWRSSRSRNGHRHRIRRVNHPSRHSLRISAFRPSVRNAFPCCISRGGTRRRYVHPGFDNYSQP
jgi:hypothetical protein